MRDIQTYLFDFGGVLIDLDRERCMEQFRLLGCPAVGQLFRDFRQQDFLYQHEKGLLSDGEFRDHVRRLCDRPLTDGEIDTAWNSFLGDIPQYKLDYLLELRRQGHPVYLLSNTNGIHWQWACEHVFARGGHRADDYFDRIFLSYEMKMAKPDSEIFLQVARDTGLVPQQTLFVDDAEANCRTAASLGFHTYTPQAHEDWRQRLG